MSVEQKAMYHIKLLDAIIATGRIVVQDIANDLDPSSPTTREETSKLSSFLTSPAFPTD